MCEQGIPLPLTNTDWMLLEQIMQQIQRDDWGDPWIMACEYSGVGPWWQAVTDKVILQSDVPRLYALAHAGG